MKGRYTVPAAFLPGVAVAQDFLEIGGKHGVRHGDAPILQSGVTSAGLKKPIQVCRRKNGILSRCVVNMKIQPTVALFADGKLGFDANEVARDMLESLAFLDLPTSLQLRKTCCEEPYDRVLAAQDRFPVLFGEPAFHQASECLGFLCGIGHIVLAIPKADFRFEIPQRTLQRQLHARLFIRLPTERGCSRGRLRA